MLKIYIPDVNLKISYPISQLYRSRLNHWDSVAHICVSKLTVTVPNKGMSPNRHQAIIWANAGIMVIGPVGTNFSEIGIGIQTFSMTKMHLKMSSAKWRPFFLGFNMLMNYNLTSSISTCIFPGANMIPQMTFLSLISQGGLFWHAIIPVSVTCWVFQLLSY